MLKTREEIKRWLDEYEVIDYTINDDLSIDVDRSVNLCYKDLIEIPVQFNKVKGNFWCHDNNLTSLIGSPKEVLGSFYCNYNKLTSLIGSPEIVKGHFWCHNNQLTSLVGSPEIVPGWFHCYWNKLTSLKYLPEISGKLVCDIDLQETVEYKRWFIYYEIKQMI